VADSPRIEDLRRRIQEDPASLAFAPLAEELRRAGRIQEAVRVCRTGLALHPEYLSARATLGRALLDLGQLDDALAELTAVLAEIHRLRGEPRVALASVDAPPPVVEPDSPDRAAVVARLEHFLAAIVADRQRRRSVPRR
jgi:tetratricopeptide (TPR) repeat protein